MKILIICSGNSCRSPMAEGMLKAKLPESVQENVHIESAGTLGIENNPATPLAILAAREKGADISTHTSQGLTKKLVQQFDVILAMAQDHVDYVKKHFSEAAKRTYLLSVYGRDPKEEYVAFSVPDPIGGSLAVYRECAEIIDTELNRMLPFLIKEVQKNTDDE